MCQKWVQNESKLSSIEQNSLIWTNIWCFFFTFFILFNLQGARECSKRNYFTDILKWGLKMIQKWSKKDKMAHEIFWKKVWRPPFLCLLIFFKCIYLKKGIFNFKIYPLFGPYINKFKLIFKLAGACSVLPSKSISTII